VTPTNNHKGNNLNEGAQDEEVIQSIFDMLGNVTELSTEEIENLLWEAMGLIKPVNVRMVILSNLLGTERTRAKDGEQMLEYIKCLVSVLEQEQRQELAALIHDLPSAVLGDIIAKEQTRVLIDLNIDVKESMKEDRVRASKKRKLVDTVTEMLLQTLSPLPPPERKQVLVFLLSKQTYSLQLKTILQQLFMSRLVSPGIASREKLVRWLMGSDGD
jgi:phenylpyruvate tautomerase PptA (4-oxalocrotonate tautomerase family)